MGREILMENVILNWQKKLQNKANRNKSVIIFGL